MKIIMTLIILSFTLPISQSRAEEVSVMYTTGNDLLGRCTGEFQLECLGYISGVVDTNAFSSNKAFCIPPGIPLGQLQKIVVKFLEDNPEKLHFGASLHVNAAFANTFPCK